MKIQFDLGLFNDNLNKARARQNVNDITANYHRGNPQSVQANKIARKGKPGSRQRILDHLQSWDDLTCEELETLLGLSHQTCSARLSELRRKGRIKIVGTRKTRSGSPAAVYQAE